MQVRLKGLKINTCLQTGNMSLAYNYPIKREFFNVFKAVEEMLGIYVTQIRKVKNDKEVINCHCYFYTSGNSQECITKFRKVQAELMLISRKAKLERMIQEISDLEGLKQHYETKTA